MMKRRAFVAFLLLFACLNAICVFCVHAQDFRVVADGVEYAQWARQVRVLDSAQTTATMPCVVNLLRIDGAKAALQLVHAKDAAIGVETTSSLANRYNALAAVNAGFFGMKGILAGDAAGVFQIDGKLLSEPFKERAACGLTNRNGRIDAVFGHLRWRGEVQIGTLRFGANPSYALSGINRLRDASEMVLFTPEFHRTTLTSAAGLEIIIVQGVVTGLRDSLGSSVIPPDGIVVSCSGTSPSSARMWAKANVRLGMSAKIISQLEALKSEHSSGFQAAEDIVGGVSQLLANGAIDLTWQREGAAEDFALARHPRTVIARLSDGRILLATVDGRQLGVSAGMTLLELAEMLKELGAVDAINLDGGGSTTMVVRGIIVNKLSDPTGERLVSDALLVFPRK